MEENKQIEDNKYYTPTIDEFFIGFEYEWKNKDNFPTSKWNIAIVKDLEQILDIHNDLYLLRVKFLDKQDILECGFEQDEMISFKETLKYNKQIKHRCFDAKLGFVYNALSNWGVIYLEDGYIHETMFEDKDCHIHLHIGSSVLFAGTIKNKSEFIKLLKQLNIK